MDKVLYKSTSMLFRKWKGKDDVGPLQDARCSSKSLPKSSISPPTTSKAHSLDPFSPYELACSGSFHSQRTMDGYSRDISQAHPSRSPNHGHLYSYPKKVMEQRNPPNSHALSCKYTSSQPSEASMRLHGRSQSALTCSERTSPSSSSSSSARSRRHGMHFHSLGNLVTTTDQGTTSTVETSNPGEIHCGGQTHLASMPASSQPTSSLQNIDTNLIRKASASASMDSVDSCSAKRRVARANSPSQNAAPNWSFCQTNDGRQTTFPSASNPPSSFSRNTPNPKSSDFSSHCRSASSSLPLNLNSQERSVPSRSNENPRTLSNALNTLPDNPGDSHRRSPHEIICRSTEGSETRMQYNQPVDRPDTHTSTSATRVGGSSSGDSGLSVTARDRLVKEINKLGDIPRDNDASTSGKLSRTMSNRSRSGMTSTQCSSIQTTTKESAFGHRAKEQNSFVPPSDINDIIPLPRREVTSRCSNAAPSPMNLPTPPPSSSTLSFLGNQLDATDVLSLYHNDSTPILHHEVTPCACKECNQRINQLEKEVRGLRYLLLDVIKSPHNNVTRSLHASYLSAKLGQKATPNNYEAEGIQSTNIQTDIYSSHSFGESSPRLPSCFEDDEDGEENHSKFYMRPLKFGVRIPHRGGQKV